MPSTSVKSFYERTMYGIERAINAYANSNDCEIISLQVSRSPKNDWFDAIVVFEKPLVISIEQANELKAAFEPDPNDQGSRPISVLG